MITRGTTPYEFFVLPDPIDKIAEAYITYSQNGEIILDKKLSDAVVEPIEETEETEAQPQTKLTLHLTQEDTLKFHFYPAAEKNIAWAQVRVLTNDNEAYATEPIQKRIYGILKDGVIGVEEEVCQIMQLE